MEMLLKSNYRFTARPIFFADAISNKQSNEIPQNTRVLIKSYFIKLVFNRPGSQNKIKGRNTVLKIHPKHLF